mmetsp:Transcript_28188/g.70417  ORF Transcript_28188/g.70417 Transcript_28188/m.70417 type:complete len:221 (-) Transcript_28188:257-919(-)
MGGQGGQGGAGGFDYSKFMGGQGGAGGYSQYIPGASAPAKEKEEKEKEEEGEGEKESDADKIEKKLDEVADESEGPKEEEGSFAAASEAMAKGTVSLAANTLLSAAEVGAEQAPAPPGPNNNETFCKFVKCPDDQVCSYGICKNKDQVGNMGSEDFKCRWVQCPDGTKCYNGACLPKSPKEVFQGSYGGIGHAFSGHEDDNRFANAYYPRPPATEDIILA